MLPNLPDVKKVVLGKEGVIEGVKRGQALIDMGSIAPLVPQKWLKSLFPLRPYLLNKYIKRQIKKLR